MLDADTAHVARELYCFGNFKILAVTLLFFLRNVAYLFDIVEVLFEPDETTPNEKILHFICLSPSTHLTEWLRFVQLSCPRVGSDRS